MQLTLIFNPPLIKIQFTALDILKNAIFRIRIEHSRGMQPPATIDTLASLYMPQDEITSVTENNYLQFVEQEAKKRGVQYRKGNTYKSRT